ncbi:DMT family transporter [uncultured Clostridium sp.]|uniref:DMT family transporter n=1 Tax=uncultured Clostridium sp. TaxID=59620 RepID=UPI0028EC5EF6|nr:DMT family transporter [uncultured Clostridium sp.]
MKNTRTIYIYLILFIGVLALSTSAIFVKLSSAPAPIVATYRMMFSTMLLLPALLFNKDITHELINLSKKQLLLGTISGAFLAFHYVLWFESLHYTSMASSTIFVTLQPLFSFAGGYFFFKERLKLFAIGGGILAIVGSFIIGLADFNIGGSALFGDILALIAAGAITIYFLIGQELRKVLSLIPYVLIAYSSSTLFLLVYSLTLGYSLTGYPSSDWLCFLGLAFVSTILGQTIFNWLIKWMNASTISMSILGEPVGTCMLAYFIFGNVITVQQFVGSLIILFGIFLFLKYNK